MGDRLSGGNSDGAGREGAVLGGGEPRCPAAEVHDEPMARTEGL